MDNATLLWARLRARNLVVIFLCYLLLRYWLPRRLLSMPVDVREGVIDAACFTIAHVVVVLCLRPVS